MSGFIGLSLKSCSADAAGSRSGIAASVLSLLFFLRSALCISSANAWLITSLHRSNLSAPCGVVLKHSSFRTLQRSEWDCALFVVDCVETGISNSASEFLDVLLGDSFTMDSCSFEWQWRDWDRVHSNFCSVYLPSVSLRGTPITLKTPSAFPMKHSVVSHSKPKFERCVGFIWSWEMWRFALPTLSHQMGQIIVSVSPHAVLSNGVFPSRSFDIWTVCILHVPPTTAE